MSSNFIRVLILSLAISLSAAFLCSCSTETEPMATVAPTGTPTPVSTPGFILPRDIPVYTYRVVNTYLHDPDAFTQGLVFEDGVLYEGTGLYGRSTLRKVDLDTGEVLKSCDLPDEYFGEGITVFGDRISQLTWRSKTGFVYDKESFDLLQTFSYPTEGWGFTHDGEHLIMSDGTSTLHFLDPSTYEETGRIGVIESLISSYAPRLNELEYVQGEIYANDWYTDRIVRIDPVTGQIVGWIDLTGLLGPEDRTRPVDVLNGIAYDAEGDRLFVTGKFWPKIFEIELIPLES